MPFLFSFGPSWFNLEYPLSQAGGCSLLTGHEDVIFSSKRAIYDCVHLAIERQPEVKPQSKIRMAQSGLCSGEVRASSSLADLFLE